MTTDRLAALLHADECEAESSIDGYEWDLCPRPHAAEAHRLSVLNGVIALTEYRLAAAINDAAVRPEEVSLGRDLRPVAARILARLAAGVTVVPKPDSPAADDGVACDWDENGYCRCKPAPALDVERLREAGLEPLDGVDCDWDESGKCRCRVTGERYEAQPVIGSSDLWSVVETATGKAAFADTEAEVRARVAALNGVLDVERLRKAAQAILDRCLDVFDPDDLDPESSFAMPVTLKARWVYALRAALATGDEP